MSTPTTTSSLDTVLSTTPSPLSYPDYTAAVASLASIATAIGVGLVIVIWVIDWRIRAARQNEKEQARAKKKAEKAAAAENEQGGADTTQDNSTTSSAVNNNNNNNNNNDLNDNAHESSALVGSGAAADAPVPDFFGDSGGLGQLQRENSEDVDDGGAAAPADDGGPAANF